MPTVRLTIADMDGHLLDNFCISDERADAPDVLDARSDDFAETLRTAVHCSLNAVRRPPPSAERILAYEAGELDADAVVALFADLIASGMAWSLQGSYGRTAAAFISVGAIDRAGKILKKD